MAQVLLAFADNILRLVDLDGPHPQLDRRRSRRVRLREPLPCAGSGFDGAGALWLAFLLPDPWPAIARAGNARGQAAPRVDSGIF